MRTLKLHLGIAVVLTLAANTSLHSQTWETILSYSPGSGRAIGADPFGNIISGGSVTDASGFDHGIVLKTDSTALTWTITDDTNPDPNQNDSYVRSVGFDANGNWYSVGQLYPPSSTGTSIPFWYVRKSSDKGLTWSTVDHFQYVQGQWVNPTGFAADDTGSIYVAGWARGVTSKKNPSGNLHWLVRKSSDAGQTWTLSDDLEGPTAGFGVGGLGFVPGRGLFAVGNEFTGGTGWQVRRSNTGQFGTWSTVDGPITGGAASGVGSDAAGNIYVVGSLFVATGTVRNKGRPPKRDIMPGRRARASTAETHGPLSIYLVMPATRQPMPTALSEFAMEILPSRAVRQTLKDGATGLFARPTFPEAGIRLMIFNSRPVTTRMLPA